MDARLSVATPSPSHRPAISWAPVRRCATSLSSPNRPTAFAFRMSGRTIVADADLLEIGEPSVGRQKRVVGS